MVSDDLIIKPSPLDMVNMRGLKKQDLAFSSHEYLWSVDKNHFPMICSLRV